MSNEKKKKKKTKKNTQELQKTVFTGLCLLPSKHPTVTVKMNTFFFSNSNLQQLAMQM